MKNDTLLVIWLVISLIWDIIVLGTCTYLVFFHGASGWWYVFAFILCGSSSLFKVLRKRFGVEEIKL